MLCMRRTGTAESLRNNDFIQLQSGHISIYNYGFVDIIRIAYKFGAAIVGIFI